MDFNEEMKEFLENHYVSSFKIRAWENPLAANCEILTLEDTLLEFQWSKAEAISLVRVNGSEVSPAKKYESIEQLLTENSPKYIVAFGNSLAAKLSELKDNNCHND
eukprot:TRINITY_DN12414_c0_g1_i2.p1 TRINITY_DN12414_c0_g1~~TRINITY_DN12414_c0_g1_i2.p1  ORF type:complete len:106 (+),score=23.96 TRINITY_DN12414_c0_g1_i2:87-404(+)